MNPFTSHKVKNSLYLETISSPVCLSGRTLSTLEGTSYNNFQFMYYTDFTPFDNFFFFKCEKNTLCT